MVTPERAHEPLMHQETGGSTQNQNPAELQYRQMLGEMIPLPGRPYQVETGARFRPPPGPAAPVSKAASMLAMPRATFSERAPHPE